MTKAEERKALDRIRKICAETGADSYIATALKGALELAEANINEDAAYSCQWYIDKYHTVAEEIRKEAEAADRAVQKAHEEARKAKEEADHDLQVARKEAREWTEAAVEMKRKWRAAVEDAEKAREDKNKAVVREAELEQEVMKLKAMLYDYMVAERK